MAQAGHDEAVVKVPAPPEGGSKQAAASTPSRVAQGSAAERHKRIRYWGMAGEAGVPYGTPLWDVTC